MTDWTQDRHAAARRACEAASEGPWRWKWVCTSVGLTTNWIGEILNGSGRTVPSGYHATKGGKCPDKPHGDAAFCAAARTDLPDALDEIERLRGLVQSLATTGRHGEDCNEGFDAECDCGWSDLVAEAQRAVGGG